MPGTDPRPTKRRVGRPSIIGGRRVNVYLDDESLDVALALGDGNISAGVRLALKTYLQVNAGAVRSLDAAAVEAALAQ